METQGAMVLRSVHLPPEMDEALRTLAFELRLSKADLIRKFVSAGLASLQQQREQGMDSAALRHEAERYALSDFERSKSNAAVDKIRRLGEEQLALQSA
jgi:hypothetical protein